MKAGLFYAFARAAYGLFIIWYGLKLLEPTEMKTYNAYIANTFSNFNVSSQFIYETFPSDYLKQFKSFTDKYVDLNVLKDNAENISQVIAFLMIFGGFLCFCGYCVSSYLVLLGMFMDLLLVHNIYYYRDEKMKVNVFRMISILIGGYFIS